MQINVELSGTFQYICKFKNGEITVPDLAGVCLGELNIIIMAH